MNGWSTHTGDALSLPMDNIDTDQLIPARFMSQPRTAGYADFLLHDIRRDANGNIDQSFALNQYPSCSVLVSGNNFGCGSSREAAVYALVDAGFKAVISTGFGDIFKANAINNGLLPAQVSAENIESLHQKLQKRRLPVSIDIESGQLQCESLAIDFYLEDSLQHKLLNGLDDIDLTLNHIDQIAAFRTRRFANHAWALPASTTNTQSN